MNDDLNAYTIEHELQVRLLNLVIDEASDYERDQLMHLMEQRPELKLYVEHLRHMHGLLVTVGGGDWNKEPLPMADDVDWKLSDERRAKLLETLAGTTEVTSTKRAFLRSPIVSNKKVSQWLRVAAVAASVCFIAAILMLPAQQAAREAARRMSPSKSVVMGDVGSYEGFSPYYLEDDVQYFPPPDSTEKEGADAIAYSLPSSSVTVPDGGSIQLGGVKRDGKFGDLSFQSDNVMDGPEGQVAIDGHQMSRDRVPSRTESQGQVRAKKAEQEFAQAGQMPPSNEVRYGGMGMGGYGGMGGMGMGAASDQSGYGGRGVDGLGPGGGYGGGYGAEAGGMGAGMGGAGMGGGMGMGMGMGGGRSVEGYDPGLSVAESDLDSFNDVPPVRYPTEEVWRDLAGQRQSLYGSETGNAPNVAANGITGDSEGTNNAVPSITNDTTQMYDKRFRADQPSVITNNFQSVPAIKSRSLESGSSSFPSSSQQTKSIQGQIDDLVTDIALPDPGPFVQLKGERSLDQQETPMMTVSPRIIIPEEEEEKVWLTMDQALAELEAEGTIQPPFGAPDIGRFAEADKSKLSSDREIALGIDAKAKPIQPTKPAAPIRELSAATEPFSTFSLFVSDVSFQLAQSALNQGQWPDRSTVRVEEFLNAFDYQDPTPNDSEMVACQIEQSTHPFLMQRNLVRVAMKTGASGRGLNMPLRLTVLLDISGSMERYDRKQAVLRAFQALVDQLRDQDQITLIGFANTPRLIADRLSAEQARSLPSLIANTPSQGGTNIEAALALAREKAREQYTIGGQNRIVMLTDGAVNLGNADPTELGQQIVELRNAGIAFDAAGVCAHGLNDEVLEALTRQGDGRYYLINAEESTSEQFSKQLAGALRPTAKNVKVQVEFNPQRVGQYRLLGFEKHQLNKEDFRNDQVDAAELAAAEAGVAMYQVEVKPDGFGDIGTVSVRFQDVSTGRMVERLWPIPYSARTPSLDAASPTMQLASAATLFAMKLRGEPSADRIELPALVSLITGLPASIANQPRVQALQTMLNQARTLGEPPQVGY
ncbi:YfbK domain-containing protein [Pirellulaceae bacterium SH449]